MMTFWLQTQLWLGDTVPRLPSLTALSLVRSFAEHKADSAVERRTAIVEGSRVFGLLFLFNNLHVAHHMRPSLPWYELPSWYARNREALAASNGGLIYRGYRDVFRQYFTRPYQQMIHPHAVAHTPQLTEGATQARVPGY